MKWSIRLGRLVGIDFRLHVTFFLLLIWVGAADIAAGLGAADATVSVLFILALFACVTLHELGHALAARRYGVATRDITLLPIGGIARLERIPENPKQEFVIAIAGPLVNVAIAAVLYVVILAGEIGVPEGGDFALVEAPFIMRLLTVNLALVFFNILPAFPMDGGRIVRSLLAMKLPYTQATSIAGSLGQFMALVFGFFGFLGNPLLIIIAVFVWIGAAQEQSQAQLRSVFAGLPVRAAMVTDFRTLSPTDRLNDAVEKLLAGTQTDFPVVDDGRLVGFLTREKLTRSLHEHGGDYPVRTSMNDDVETLDEAEMLSAAFERMQQSGTRSMPVVRGETVVGILTTENVGEYVQVATALGRAASSSFGRAASGGSST